MILSSDPYDPSYRYFSAKGTSGPESYNNYHDYKHVHQVRRLCWCSFSYMFLKVTGHRLAYRSGNAHKTNSIYPFSEHMVSQALNGERKQLLISLAPIYICGFIFFPIHKSQVLCRILSDSRTPLVKINGVSRLATLGIMCLEEVHLSWKELWMHRPQRARIRKPMCFPCTSPWHQWKRTVLGFQPSCGFDQPRLHILLFPVMDKWLII